MKKSFIKHIKVFMAMILAFLLVLPGNIRINAGTQAGEGEANLLELDFSTQENAALAMSKLTAYSNTSAGIIEHAITDRWEYSAENGALMYKKAAVQSVYALIDMLKLDEEYLFKNFDVTVTYHATANAMTVNGGVWVGGRIQPGTSQFNSGNDTSFTNTQASAFVFRSGASTFSRLCYSSETKSAQSIDAGGAIKAGENTLRMRMIGNNCTIWNNGIKAGVSGTVGITAAGALSFAVSGGGAANGADKSFGFKNIQITPP